MWPFTMHKHGIRMALGNGGKFFLLSAGDQYNWTERKVVKWAGNGRDIFSER